MTQIHNNMAGNNMAGNNMAGNLKAENDKHVQNALPKSVKEFIGSNVRISYDRAPYQGPQEPRAIGESVTRGIGRLAQFTRVIKGVSGTLKQVNDNSALIENPVLSCEFQVYSSLKPNMYPGASRFETKYFDIRLQGEMAFDLKDEKFLAITKSPICTPAQTTEELRSEASQKALERKIDKWRGLIGSNVSVNFRQERCEAAHSLDLSNLKSTQEYTGRYSSVHGKLVDIKDGKAVIEDAIQNCEIRTYLSKHRYPSKLRTDVTWEEIPVVAAKAYELKPDTEIKKADKAAA